MGPYQDQCSAGLQTKTAGADLTGKEGYLAKLDSSGNVVVISNAAHNPVYVIVEGAASGEPVKVAPWCAETEHLLVAAASVTKGDYVEFTTAGKVQTFSSGTKIGQAVSAASADGKFLIVQRL